MEVAAVALVALAHLQAGDASSQELPVDLELVLAVDVSGSIDAEEARQQREGYVAAIGRSGGGRRRSAPASTGGSPSPISNGPAATISGWCWTGR